MKFNQSLKSIELNIENSSHDGRGIASIDGKTAFIDGAIMGEKVIGSITRQNRRYYEGHVLEVLKSAPERTTPPCTHFGTCGGCSLQHMTIASQIDLKQQTLLQQLKHFGHVTPEVILPPLSGQTEGYRGKARLGVRFVYKKDKLLVGFREKQSNYLADLQNCLILNPIIGLRLTHLAKLVRSLSQYEHIPQIEVACGDHDTALIIRHMTTLSQEDQQKICDFAKTYALHIYLQPNPPEKVHKIWPIDQNEFLTYTIPQFQIEMQFHPLSFTQVNAEMNQKMISAAIELLAPNPEDHILDLFCGLGNFTLPLARFAKKVIGVEGSQEMVNYAKKNAQHNGLYNTDFFAANLMAPVLNAPFMQPYDKILLDPPRTGAKEIIAYFKQFNAKKIVYVSCNPATLARDANELVNIQGYTLKKAGIINMFPHTSHIEAIALFEKY